MYSTSYTETWLRFKPEAEMIWHTPVISTSSIVIGSFFSSTLTVLFSVNLPHSAALGSCWGGGGERLMVLRGAPSEGIGRHLASKPSRKLRVRRFFIDEGIEPLDWFVLSACLSLEASQKAVDIVHFVDTYMPLVLKRSRPSNDRCALFLLPLFHCRSTTTTQLKAR